MATFPKANNVAGRDIYGWLHFFGYAQFPHCFCILRETGKTVTNTDYSVTFAIGCTETEKTVHANHFELFRKIM